MPDARARIVLAFDFGLRRIGVASGDSISRTAAPCTALNVGPAGVPWTQIDALLRSYRPDVLVVGHPCNTDGTPGRMAPHCDRFASDLSARSSLPVRRTDEYGSSLEASAHLKQARASGQRRRRLQRDDIDSAAAAIILERWFNERPSDD